MLQKIKKIKEILMATRKKAQAQKQNLPVETGAQKLWDQIKNLPLEIFSLPNQLVQNHVTRESGIEKAIPDSLHLTLKSSAVLPALEETLNKVRLPKNNLGQQLVFDLSQLDRYTVVKIVPRS
jgi:hypothetical protein